MFDRGILATFRTPAEITVENATRSQTWMPTEEQTLKTVELNERYANAQPPQITHKELLKPQMLPPRPPSRSNSNGYVGIPSKYANAL